MNRVGLRFHLVTVHRCNAGFCCGVGLFFICSLTFCAIFSHKIPKNYNLSTFHALLDLFCLQVDTQPLFHVLSMKQPD